MWGFVDFYARGRTVDNVTSHRAEPAHPAPSFVADRPVRILGGIISVFLLSIVAAILTAFDRVDRSRIERSVFEQKPGDAPRPRTHIMSARSIDPGCAPQAMESVENTAA